MVQDFLLSFLAFLALVILHHLQYAGAQCSRNPVIINFGDSNSDTGGYAIVQGLNNGQPNGRAFFHSRNGGRLCDGRLVIDFLCESLKTRSYLTPYLESMNPDLTNGVNFAIAGAGIAPHLSFSLVTQIKQFIRFRNRSIEYQSKGFKNLIREEDFKNALYTFDIGQNDLTYAEVIDHIPSFISYIRDAMSTVYQVGGKNFWVHNVGPLGCLPKNLATKHTNATDYDKNGCLLSLNDAVKKFNVKLNALCQQLRLEMKNSTIVYVDMYSAKYDLIVNAASYGFKNPLMACWGYGGPPYNYNPKMDHCMHKDCVCRKESRHVNWDGIHYTEAANSIIASKILSTNYSTPLNFNYFCNL